MKLTLPIPSSKLASNQSKGKSWLATYNLRTNARLDGYFIALAALKMYPGTFALSEQLECSITVYFASGRHLDDDNFLTALKATRDGIFDALNKKFGINDRQITKTILDTAGRDKENPRVEWELISRK